MIPLITATPENFASAGSCPIFSGVMPPDINMSRSVSEAAIAITAGSTISHAPAETDGKREQKEI
jgi:hypothetical protein